MPVSSELKPCPFCGGKADYHNDVGPNDEGFWSWYECDDCGAKVDTIEAWNRRAALSLPQGAPDGYVTVPIEPTPEQITAGVEGNPTVFSPDTDRGFPAEVANDVYYHMLRASPPPQPEGRET